MEEYKQYLSDDADDEERLAAAKVMEGLNELRLLAKVEEAAAERAALYRRRRWKRVVIVWVALAFFAGAAYLFFDKKGKQMPSAAPVPSIEQPSRGPESAPASDPPNINTTGEPIARVMNDESLPKPRFPAPTRSMMRGGETTNKNPKILLDQIWYVDYPLKNLTLSAAFAKADENLKKRDFTSAYLELNRLETHLSQNDTLLYLKGYCLLEMGEGAEALAIFGALRTPPAAWESQLQWYGGLAVLLTGDRARALTHFKQLAAQPKHPYQRQAKKAVELMR